MGTICKRSALQGNSFYYYCFQSNSFECYFPNQYFKIDLYHFFIYIHWALHIKHVLWETNICVNTHLYIGLGPTIACHGLPLACSSKSRLVRPQSVLFNHNTTYLQRYLCIYGPIIACAKKTKPNTWKDNTFWIYVKVTYQCRIIMNCLLTLRGFVSTSAEPSSLRMHTLLRVPSLFDFLSFFSDIIYQ